MNKILLTSNMRIQFLLLFLFSAISCLAQEKGWKYEISFQLNHYQSLFSFQDFQLFVDDIAYEYNLKRALTCDPETGKYTLLLEYSCEKCGFRSFLPPDFYLKVNYERIKTQTNLSTFIPIVFEGSRPRILEPFDLGTIPVMDFINGYRVDENSFVLPPYVAIRVAHYSRIEYLGKYEFQWRKMQELVEVELKPENQ